MPASQYADLEVRILDKANAYSVEITVNQEQQYGPGVLDPALLTWSSDTPSTKVGEDLFGWLTSDEKIAKAWAEIRGRFPNRRLRLRLDVDTPELHQYPWELLRETSAGTTALDLAATSATPFSRYLTGEWRPGNPVFKRPLRILVVIPCPTNLDSLRLPSFDYDEELMVLQTAIKEVDVEITSLPQPCTLSMLEQELRKGYHVLHIIAHGQYDSVDNIAEIVMANDANLCDLVTENRFAEMLARQWIDSDRADDDRLRLVYLDSCETAMRDVADAFRGFAPALVKTGVPAVIAMQEAVPVPTAQGFSATFYRQLLEHGYVDLACNEARSSLITAGLPGAQIPVLFMRLRDGLLLGRHGRVSSASDKLFWPFLLENIAHNRCVPIIGPRAHTGLLPDSGDVAERLAEEFGYPWLDQRNLAHVAQYMEAIDRDILRSKYLQILQRSLFRFLGITPNKEERKVYSSKSFVETVSGLDWAQRVRTIQETEIHHILAELELPLYVTTNFDNFLVQCLRNLGKKEVRQAEPRWSFEAGSPQYVIQPKPSKDQPLVFHLNGFQPESTQEQHLLLSEDDFLGHYVRMSRDQDMVLPMNVVEAISSSSLLLIGFSIEDWEFRVVIQALLGRIAQTGSTKKTHVGVQLDDTQSPNADKITDYLRRFLGRFNIEIYWGTSQQFASELSSRWRNYLDSDDDTWK